MSEDYDVGFRKPPKSGQFKKGQSGNPNGRPKKKKADHSLQSAVLNMLDSQVNVTEDGKTRRAPVSEAMVMKLRNDILTGSPAERARAIKMLREVCPGYNVPEEFADAPTEIAIKLIESDGFGKEFKATPEDIWLLKAIWRQHRDGHISLSRIIEAIERKLGRQIVNPLHAPSERTEIRT
jgi:hypothetical protein